jgi:flagellar assembly factor FliW
MLNHIDTKYFGSLDYQEASVIQFPAGLPGFDAERLFLLMDEPSRRPLVFLQSLSRSELCFLTVPAQEIDPVYELRMTGEDLQILGIGADGATTSGADLLCLAIVTVDDDQTATANLLAPVVVDLANRRGVQAVREDLVYSCRQPLKPCPEETPCL